MDYKSGAGFTLIELLIVIFIISLLSSVSFVYLRGGEKEFALSRSAQKLAQDLRKAQEWAMSAKEMTGPSGEKVTPAGGYGIYLKTLPNPPYFEIIFFADCNDNKSFNLGKVCGTPPNKFSEKIEDLRLEPKVIISNLSPSSPLTITFKPPDPTVYIQGGDLAEITLSLEADPAKIKKIKVNKAGLIAIE